VIKVLELMPQQGEKWVLKELVLVHRGFPPPLSTLLLISYSVVELWVLIMTIPLGHCLGLALRSGTLAVSLL